MLHIANLGMRSHYFEDQCVLPIRQEVALLRIDHGEAVIIIFTDPTRVLIMSHLEEAILRGRH